VLASNDGDDAACRGLALQLVTSWGKMATALSGTAEVPIQGAIYYFDEDPNLVVSEAHPEL